MNDDGFDYNDALEYMLASSFLSKKFKIKFMSTADMENDGKWAARQRADQRDSDWTIYVAGCRKIAFAASLFVAVSILTSVVLMRYVH
jgi:hypothetical protein